MLTTPMDLAAMAEALGRSPEYRVLRRLVARAPYAPIAGQEVRTGILLDTETSGLDHRTDEIIELGMVKFDYTADGSILGVRDTFSAFNEPGGPISAEVTALTGITDEMVAGHRFDDAAIAAFLLSRIDGDPTPQGIAGSGNDSGLAGWSPQVVALESVAWRLSVENRRRSA